MTVSHVSCEQAPADFDVVRLAGRFFGVSAFSRAWEPPGAPKGGKNQ
jgi:hypothetical protein